MVDPPELTFAESTVVDERVDPSDAETKRTAVKRDVAASEQTSTIPPTRFHTDGSQSRYDNFRGRWVVFAPQRGLRPNDFLDPPRVVAETILCPFCAGNESQTPPAVLTVKASGVASERTESQSEFESRDNWSVRVVPNKYPAVTSNLESAATDAWSQTSSTWTPRQNSRVEVCGGHEVIIESSEHAQSWTHLDAVNVESVFLAWAQRLTYWRHQPHARFASLFKNVGREAGASLQHCHSQLVVLDQLPIAVAGLLRRLQRHHARSGCCLQCDVIRHELKSRERLIAQVDDLVAYCPYASEFGLAVKITTVHHADCFEDLSDKLLRRLAGLVQRVTGWLERIRPGVAYNYVLNSRPPHWDGDPASYHWSIEVLPRVGHIAGFEIGSGTMINNILPEVAAAEYRKLAKDENPSRL